MGALVPPFPSRVPSPMPLGSGSSPRRLPRSVSAELLRARCPWLVPFLLKGQDFGLLLGEPLGTPVGPALQPAKVTAYLPPLGAP